MHDFHVIILKPFLCVREDKIQQPSSEARSVDNETDVKNQENNAALDLA